MHKCSKMYTYNKWVHRNPSHHIILEWLFLVVVDYGTSFNQLVTMILLLIELVLPDLIIEEHSRIEWKIHFASLNKPKWDLDSILSKRLSKKISLVKYDALNPKGSMYRNKELDNFDIFYRKAITNDVRTRYIS